MSESAPRILVVTLHTIENEFAECVAAIERQTYTEFEHLIISNKPSTEAHEELYSTFRDRSDEFDLLIKVDADMVIEDVDLLRSIVQTFDRHPGLQLFTMYIYDFFSQRMVSGLHTFHKTAKWPKMDPAYPDNHDVQPRHMLIDKRHLGQKVIHCKNPSMLQALHWGIHRGVKLRQCIQREEYEQMYGFGVAIEDAWKHFKQINDRRLGLAALGAEMALQRRFDLRHLDYSQDSPARMIKPYEKTGAAALEKTIRSLRRDTWGVLPWRWRIEALWPHRLSLPWRCLMPQPWRKKFAALFGSAKARLQPAATDSQPDSQPDTEADSELNSQPDLPPDSKPDSQPDSPPDSD